MIFEIFSILFGVSLLVYLSPRVITNASALAKMSKISPLIIGILIIGIGTSVPEISNSIISSMLGHGDINVGNVIGSSISQITLVFGICILVGGVIKTDRRDVLELGLSTLLATILGVSIIMKGVITQLDGLLLISSYFILILILRNYVRKSYFPVETEERVYETKRSVYVLKLGLSLLGIVIGSFILVTSVISISGALGIPEFIISFLAIGISTSLPEIVIGISAVRQKEYELLLGDIFGSNIVDLTLSLGAGPAIFTNVLSGRAIGVTGLYLLLVTLIVTLIFSWKKKLDRKMSIPFILLYLISIPLLAL